jgi:molecular chaperone HtpG
MATGKINVSADNIFPIIKKFLYSDHEIFLRELISNAVDATNKLKTLSNLGEFKGELGDLTIQVHIDKKKKQLRIVDRGIGMTHDEVQKYINDVAFSGAEEFVKQYEGKVEKGAMIGHFGLGFYSSFMVSSQVEIKTRSWKSSDDKEGAHWSCDGSPEFELKGCTKKDRGTEIILHIDSESEDFLEEFKIKELLKKYARFMSIPIQCGEKEERVNVAAEGEEAKYETVKKADIINETEPAWTKKPSELSGEDYNKFYKALYPYTVEDPLFHIHINVDYPFDLTGILFFPKIKPNMELQKNKIQLYQSQVFITDNVEGIVIDSKDIPLNVSRSYLQADGNVKKISGHITKKVADKLEEMFKADRADFEAKWKDISVIIEYGMVTEEKFYERAKKFNLFKSVIDDSCYTMEEYVEKISAFQTDKDGQRVILYASNADAQHSYIQKAKAEGYDVILLESPIAGHSIQKFEGSEEKVRFARVDSDLLDKLIPKGDERTSILTDKEVESLKSHVEAALNSKTYTVRTEALGSDDAPMLITIPEFMRRMKEMSATGGGGFMGMGDFPVSYDLVVNTNHPLSGKILQSEGEERDGLIAHAKDLALLQQNLLQGEALTTFVNRAMERLV